MKCTFLPPFSQDLIKGAINFVLDRAIDRVFGRLLDRVLGRMPEVRAGPRSGKDGEKDPWAFAQPEVGSRFRPMSGATGRSGHAHKEGTKEALGKAAKPLFPLPRPFPFCPLFVPF